MRSLCLFVLTALVWAVGAASAVPAAAQNQPNLPKENIRASGKLAGSRGKVLFVITEKGDRLFVKAPDQAKDMMFSATAQPRWLRPGMWVRLTGEFDNKGRPQSDVTELMIFTPNEQAKIGVFPEVGSAAKDLFASDEDKKTKRREDVATYLVAGRLTGVRDNRLTVAAGRVTVQVKLAEEAKIRVDVSDLRFAREGDNISFEGWYYPQMRNQIYARRITVSAAEPLGSDKKSKKPPTAGASDKETKAAGREKAGDEEKRDDPADGA